MTGRPGARAVVALVVGMACAGAAAGCARRALGPEEARLSVPDGAQVRVLAGAGAWRNAEDGEVLRGGDRVEVRGGRAVLAFARDRRVELRAAGGVVGRAPGEIEVGAVPRLRAGEALVVSQEATLSLTATDTVVRVTAGAGRVTQVLGNVVAASYEGDLAVRSAGRLLTVPALRQTTIVAAGLVPARPSPLRYDPRNPFDRRYLGDAIALGEELAARVRGFTENLQLAPGEGRTPGFFRELLPALERERRLQALLDELDGKSRLTPPEKLVGAAIATQSRRGRFAARWQATFAFRNAGAEWGLVALDQRVERTPLLRELDVALGRRGLTPIASPASSASFSVSPLRSLAVPPSTPPPDSAPGREPSQPTSRRRSSSPVVTAPPAIPLVPQAPVPTEPADAIVDTVNDLLNGLPARTPLP
jgi:hypothetical protein